jgi:hypothetical protein
MGLRIEDVKNQSLELDIVGYTTIISIIVLGPEEWEKSEAEQDKILVEISISKTINKFLTLVPDVIKTAFIGSNYSAAQIESKIFNILILHGIHSLACDENIQQKLINLLNVKK